MGETTIDRVQRDQQIEERKAMDEATDDVVRRVLRIANAREATRGEFSNPTEVPLDFLDLALLTIKYGNFSEEGFFKILRNTSFAWALAVSLIVGLLTWALTNVINLIGLIPTSK